MDNNKKTMGKEGSGASPGAEGWKDILQLLREQSEKMEVLARALSIIEQGMPRKGQRERGHRGVERNVQHP